MSNEPGTSDYGHAMRARALTLTEDQLRRAVDHLLEQCGREESNMVPGSARAGMLHTSEIYFVMGIGPIPGADNLEELRRIVDRAIDAEKTGPNAHDGPICVDPRCPAGHAHYGQCPGQHRKDGDGS